MSFSKERSIERSPRSGRNVENSPIAFSNSENLRPSNKTPTTGFDLPVNRETRICQHASRNDDSDTLLPSTMALIRALVVVEISNGSEAGWKDVSSPACFSKENLRAPTSAKSWFFQNCLATEPASLSSNSFCHSAKSAYCIESGSEAAPAYTATISLTKYSKEAASVLSAGKLMLRTCSVEDLAIRSKCKAEWSLMTWTGMVIPGNSSNVVLNISTRATTCWIACRRRSTFSSPSIRTAHVALRSESPSSHNRFCCGDSR